MQGVAQGLAVQQLASPGSHTLDGGSVQATRQSGLSFTQRVHPGPLVLESALYPSGQIFGSSLGIKYHLA